MPNIVQQGRSGLVFAPANPEFLLSKVRTALEFPGLLERLGCGARAESEAHYPQEANYRMLIAIYQRALETYRGRRKE